MRKLWTRRARGHRGDGSPLTVGVASWTSLAEVGADLSWDSGLPELRASLRVLSVMANVFGSFKLDVPGSWLIIAEDRHRDDDQHIELPAIIRDVGSRGEKHVVIFGHEQDDLLKVCDRLGIWSITRTNGSDGLVAIMHPTEVEPA